MTAAAPGARVAAAPAGPAHHRGPSVRALARAVTTRVRLLPPHSPGAIRAAHEIRKASHLLRTGKAREAHALLTELLRVLESTLARQGGSKPASSEVVQRARLERFLSRGHRLEEEGLPFPSERVHRTVEAAIRSGHIAEAAALLTSAEKIIELAHRKWAPIRDLLGRDDRLREVAVQLGIDIPGVEGGLSSPRDLLRSGPLSEALLTRVRTAASASVRALSNEVLQYGVTESRKLGTKIRAASQRGEDVTETTEAFRRLVRTIGARAAIEVGDRLVELRRAVARIPSAPAFPVPMTDEEREVVLEARHLARRIHRIKRNARDAPSAARLMTHVRAALSEDRRYGTPQEEVEELWGEVARLTKENLIENGFVPPERTLEAPPPAPEPVERSPGRSVPRRRAAPSGGR